MELNLVKMAQTEHSTVSRLFIEDKFLCFVIEDGEHQNKIFGSTRIPSGRYDVIRRKDGRFYDKYSQRYGHECVFQIVGVQNFVGILFHIGNRIENTNGCLLLNQHMSFDGQNYYGINSTTAYKRFYTRLSAVKGRIKMDVIR